MDLQIYNCTYHLRLKLRVALQVSTYLFLTKIYPIVLGFFLFFEWYILLLIFFNLISILTDHKFFKVNQPTDT